MTDLAWVERLTGLEVVETTETTFRLSDGTEHTLDGNLIARLQRHGVIPPSPWPRVLPQDVRSPHCTVGRTFAWGQDGGRKTIDCGQPAVIVILTATDHGACCCGDHEVSEVHAYPVCADHAPEEVHEARCSMDESEFLVLTLPTKED